MKRKTVNGGIGIGLREMLRVLLSKLWLILLLGVLLGLGMLVYSKYVIEPVYSSTTKVYVLDKQNIQNSGMYSDLQTDGQMTRDFMELVKSRPVLEQVVENLELDMRADAFAQMIHVSSPNGTKIVVITVNSTDAYLAQRAADEVRKAAVEYICKIMELEKVNTVEEADFPTVPVAPDVRGNTVMGFVIGVLSGVGLVVVLYILGVLLHMLDDSIRTPDDVERFLGVGVLASIPMVEQENRKHKKYKNPEVHEEEAEKESPRGETYEEDSLHGERAQDEVDEEAFRGEEFQESGFGEENLRGERFKKEHFGEENFYEEDLSGSKNRDREAQDE